MGNSGSTSTSATPPTTSNCHLLSQSVQNQFDSSGFFCGHSSSATSALNSGQPAFLDDLPAGARGGGGGGGYPSPLLHKNHSGGHESGGGSGSGQQSSGSGHLHGGKKRRGNLSSLATLRKRFVRKGRRSSKCLDHAQVMRDFLAGWSTRDLLALVEEYEGTRLLKELHLQAEVARPSASTVASDLTELYDYKYAADTHLIFKGVSFPVHKAIICVRCPLFRELLGKVNTFGAQVPVSSIIDIPGLRADFFNDLLRYLYSGELTPFSSQSLPPSSSSSSSAAAAASVDPASSSSSSSASYDAILLRLSEQFGVPNALDSDLKHLLNTGLYSDASLVFSPPSPPLPDAYGQSATSGNGSNGASSSHSTTNTTTASPPSLPNVFTKKCRACSDQAEYSCHSAILASRSPFFKNVILRHQRRFTEAQQQQQLKQQSLMEIGPNGSSSVTSSTTTINTANQKIRIVLDESIISRRFARIILHSMYRDSIDLMSLLPGCVCKCSQMNTESSTVTSGAGSSSGGGNGSNSNGTNGSNASGSALSSSAGLTGSFPNNPSSSMSTFSNSSHYAVSTTSSANILPSSYVKEVMDLYEIARFLELDSLIVSCEDIIVDSLTVDNLVAILKWSEQAHGSPWVKRQALCFLREEFSAIASTPVLHQLEISHLLEAIKSDFLQASELEVLQAVIKWAENRLLKRMEEREPNIVSQTAHSLRRGLRKKELNDGELRDILSDLMPHIRFGHILPLDSECLTSALKRGLISTLPPFMLGEDSGLPYVRGISSWLRSKSTCGTFYRPRLFNPYMEEAKTCLEERLGRPGEMIPNSRCTRGISQIPDALYMIDNTGVQSTMSSHEFFNAYSTYPEEYPEVLVTSKALQMPVSSQLPVIEQRIVVLMKQREDELKTLALSHRGLALISSSRHELMRLIQLRVIREFGLPDAAVEVLSGEHYVPYPPTEMTTSDEMTTTGSYGVSGMIPSSGVLSNLGSNSGDMDSEKSLYNMGPGICLENRTASECYLSAYNYESDDYYRANHHHHRLSGVMPDIAMATSALVDLHIYKQRSTDSLIRQQQQQQQQQQVTASGGSGHVQSGPRPGTSLDFDRFSFLQ